jgi:hypothetical protein
VAQTRPICHASARRSRWGALPRITVNSLSSAWMSARPPWQSTWRKDDGRRRRLEDLCSQSRRRHRVDRHVRGADDLVWACVLELPFYQGLLAEIEAQEDAAGALIRTDEALALARETGEHWSDALLHRLRAEILLSRDPANTAQAENAFLTAIAIAQQQKARSFELCAVLDLARVYKSTGRSADAHALLAPALKGFSPTPEFPEIEAQTLLTALTS